MILVRTHQAKIIKLPPKRHKNVVDSSAKQSKLSLSDVQENIIRILSEKINERSDQLERMVKENSFNIEALGKSLTSVHDDVMVLQKENEMLKNVNALLEKKAGPAPHAAPSTLVETTGSTQRMASRTPAHQGESGLCDSSDPLEEPMMDEEGRGHGVGLQQESCHDRRLQHRLGGAVRRQTDLRPLVEGGEGLPHQLLGNASSLSSLPVFPARPNRTPCADSLRQHVRGVLYKSSGRCLLEAPLHSGRAPSGMGSAQPALAEGSTPAGQIEPRSGYVISEQCPLGGVDAPSADGSEDLEDLWQGRSRPFHLQRQLSLPNLLFKGPTSSFMHSPRSPCFHRSSGVSGNRVTRCYWWPPCGGTNLGCQSRLSC